MSKTNKKTQNNSKPSGRNSTQQRKQTKSQPKQGRGQQRSGKQASVAAAYATRSEGKAPKIQASRDTCNIKHREFIGNVSGSNLFQVALTLSVNPGLSTTFPWLSIMAQAWEQYKFRKLRFVFLTRTGSNTPGSVIMSPDYDSSDAAPATEQIMSTYDGTVEDAPWKDNSCNLKVNLLSGAGGPRKFVRTGALLPNQDIKLYDVANMFVGTVDGTNVAWGKLWVEYDIDFWVPQLPPVGLPSLLQGGSIAGGGVLTAANPLGTLPVLDVQSSGLTVDSTSLITFLNPGTQTIYLNLTGTGLSGAVVSAISGAPSISSSTGMISSTQISVLWTVVTTVPNSSVRLSVTASTVTFSAVSIGSSPFGSQA